MSAHVIHSRGLFRLAGKARDCAIDTTGAGSTWFVNFLPDWECGARILTLCRMIGGEQLPFRNKDIVNYSKVVIIFNDNLLSLLFQRASTSYQLVECHFRSSFWNMWQRKANEGQLDSELFIVFLWRKPCCINTELIKLRNNTLFLVQLIGLYWWVSFGIS